MIIELIVLTVAVAFAASELNGIRKAHEAILEELEDWVDSQPTPAAVDFKDFYDFMEAQEDTLK